MSRLARKLLRLFHCGGASIIKVFGQVCEVYIACHKSDLPTAKDPELIKKLIEREMNALCKSKAASPEAVRKLIALTDVARGRDGGDTSTNARKINGHRRPRRLRTWR